MEKLGIGDIHRIENIRRSYEHNIQSTPDTMHPHSLNTVPENMADSCCDCFSIYKSTADFLREMVTAFSDLYPDMIAQLTSLDYVMLLNDKPTTVGRTLDTTLAEIVPAGTDSRISRKHFTIAYGTDGNFTLLCLSKNGIMIDEQFHCKQEQPYILPHHCIIRFPSTSNVIHFKSLIHCRSTDEFLRGISGSSNSHPTSSTEEPGTLSIGAERPPYSYSQLIIQAICASPEKKLPLCKIYSFIMEKYPYYREFAIKSWQNSIRHNLSMKGYFLKTPQPEPNIGHLWMLRPSYETQLFSKRFQVRRNRTQVKKI